MKGKSIIQILILISPFFAGWIALFVGAFHVSPMSVLRILFQDMLPYSGFSNSPESSIILDIRLPRVVLAGLVGTALAGSGVTLQGIFRNPLVDPFILGISAGAALGCALSIGFFSHLPLQLMAFVFGMASVLLTYSIAKTQGEVSRLPLILSGVIMSAFFTAMVSIVKFLVDPHKLQSIVFWLMGSFSLSDWKLVKIAGIGIAAGLLPVFLMRWRLNALSMGESEAKSLGVNVKRERMIFIAASSLAVSVAVSVSGIIGWVGLMVPHLVRMTTGPDHKSLVPLSMAGGAAFMIVADTLARSLTNFDVPVGIITAITGAPFFIYLMKKGGKESWGT
ncbi:FecCD family ABC transporter permease [Desulfomonile tiedjei]|uniref:ABC-type Fe3+-siderophore transport system, permease component n=1 Tax=Desulfomonile tiedjei (strain ATCC 49306 / DSM 6799 / DCB-1) TaxID=706587 RepID=I4CER0_DESTA|nr:iron ABC transporter permease [Desulfomonile tiedjei]AFM28051.1 ABC-type Fe3+-siderophore transport system, permease component [Desulfomonile tiedjei DSM 6799]